MPDAVVIGAGPNGLVAAIALARAGWSVEVLERAPVVGGAVGSDTTADGWVHDWGSAFYGVLHASPVLAELGLDTAVAWARTPVPVAASYRADRPAALLHADPYATAAGLGPDGPAWQRLVDWWDRSGADLFALLLDWGAPDLRRATRVLGRTGLRGGVQLARTMLEPLEAHAAWRFAGDPARMLLASHATHADTAVDGCGSTPPALLLALAAQRHGMPVPVGGAAALAQAMAARARREGVVIRTGEEVVGVLVRAGRAVAVRTAGGEQVPARRAVVAETAPGVLARDLVGEQHLPAGWLDQLRRHRLGSGFFRLDVDLAAPAPWHDPALRDAGVVHVTGSLDELALEQATVRRGLLPDRPQLIVGQQDRADPSRVPQGRASLWVECHCPARPRGEGPGWEQRFADRVLGVLRERAPGLDVVRTAATAPLGLQRRDPTLLGGDVAGGSALPDQLAMWRPVAGWSPYALPVRGLYQCSAATHPGGGVHGMCGRNAARTVLRRERLSWR